jgi:hypothetical protein
MGLRNDIDTTQSNQQNQNQNSNTFLNNDDVEYILKLIFNSKFEVEGKDLQTLFTVVTKLQNIVNRR